MEKFSKDIKRDLVKWRRGGVKKYIAKVTISFDWNERGVCGDCQFSEWSDEYNDMTCKVRNMQLSEYIKGLSEYRPLWCPMVLTEKE